MGVLGWSLVVLGLVVVAASAAWAPWQRRRRRRQFVRDCGEFHLRREQLEAKFFDLAAGTGKPRGLRWTNCEFADDVTYARDRSSGQLSALVSITIAFEAIEGGGMEEVEAVANLRAATAVFQRDQNGWSTQGRAIFNLNPAEAVKYYHANLELVAHEAAHSTAH